METIELKFTKFDGRPWGFRLAGGADFPEPLTAIKVSEESLAECMGLKVGDVILRINDWDTARMMHAQAHEAFMLAGNNFVLLVQRPADPSDVAERFAEDKIEPYMLPLEDILFPPPPSEDDQPPEEFSADSDHHQVPEGYYSEYYEQQEVSGSECCYAGEQEPDLSREKPCDENSDPVPNKNLTDEEIADLIAGEEEVLDESGVLGVNFKKLRPRYPLLRESKVFQELQNELVSEPARPERHFSTTFLQKPERPVPRSPEQEQREAQEVQAYRVVIKKQPRRPVIDRLVARGLLDPSQLGAPSPGSPEPPAASSPVTEVGTPPGTPEPPRPKEPEVTSSRAATPSEAPHQDSAEEAQSSSGIQEVPESSGECQPEDSGRNNPKNSGSRRASDVDVEVTINMDRDKIRELVSTEISLEKQLESVQMQLLALKQLPSEIEKHLRVVSEQLHKIMELSGVGEQSPTPSGSVAGAGAGAKATAVQQDNVARILQEEQKRRLSQDSCQVECWEDQSENCCCSDDCYDDGRKSSASQQSSNVAQIIGPSDEESESNSKELEISVKSNESGFKKFVVSYESKVIEETTSQVQQQRNHPKSPSSAASQDSFEPDPNLPLTEQLIQEMQHRQGRKRSHEPMWPQAKQLELTYGRRWRCPNDFFNDEMIADVLSSQAEVIRGRTLGVNFKKFEKKALPNYDHLMNSSVYKMIHKMEAEPKKGIPARPPKVVAAEDIIERVGTPCFGVSA